MIQYAFRISKHINLIIFLRTVVIFFVLFNQLNIYKQTEELLNRECFLIIVVYHFLHFAYRALPLLSLKIKFYFLQQPSLLNEVDILRDGRMQKIQKVQIVPGDIIRLERGSIVPADGRVIRIDEQPFLLDEIIYHGEAKITQK